MMAFSRFVGESVYEYQIRLCSQRKELGLTWQMLASLVNQELGKTFTKDYYQHWWSNFQEGMQYGMSMSEKKYLKDLEDKLLDIKKATTRLQDQRREWNKLAKDEARLEYFHELMLEEVRVLGDSKPLLPAMEFPVEYKIHGKRMGTILFGDWHTGLFAVNYWNRFDNAELVRRVRRYVKKSMEYLFMFGIDILHIFNLGDFINGLIHITTRILSTENAVSQTMLVCEILAEVFAEYANVFKQISLYFVRGNHDRVTPNKSDEIAQESFADFIPFYLKARLAKFSNITFVENRFDDEIADATICGKVCLATHGHRDKVTDVVENLTLMTRVVPDYVFMGHYHHDWKKEVQQSKVIVNSSLSGVDTYAKEIRKVNIPAQKLLIFEEVEGIISEHDIRLDIA